MTRPFLHPSRSKLRDWLQARLPSPKVTTHVETCERCASRLVDLADRETNGAEKATGEARLAQIVKTEWVPPADLTERVIRTIGERERNQRDLNVVLGLFGVATETASLMFPEDERTPGPDAVEPDEPDRGPSEGPMEG